MNQGNRNRAEVSGGSDNTQWKPRATEKNGMMYDPNNPANFKEGYLSGVKDIKGKDGVFVVFEIQTMNPDGSLGEVFDIIGDTVLKDRLDKIEIGAYVGLKYEGRTHKKGYPTNSPWSQTNSYHNWKVFEDKNAVKLQSLMGIKSNGAPVSNAPAPQANTMPQGNGGYQQPAAPQGNQQWTPPAGNSAMPQGNGFPQQGNQMQGNNFPPAGGNFGGNQQPIQPMNGGKGQNMNQGGGNPFMADDSDLPFAYEKQKGNRFN